MGALTSLAGKTVAVIGGTSGIGLEVASQARALGAAIVLVERTVERLAAAYELVEGAVGFQADAHDHVVAERVMNDLPPFDHLASSIGDTIAGGFYETPMPTMQHVLFSKFWTNLVIARFTAPRVCGSGSLVFTSGSGVRAQEASASYTANLASDAMVQGLASELGSRVRVNAVAPGFMDTALWRNKPREAVEARIRSFCQTAPIGRPGSAQEVVAAVYLFLKMNPSTTGQTLSVHGGVMLRK